MSFDKQVHLIADSYVRERWGEGWVPTQPFTMDDPPGMFFWVERVDHGQYLDGPSPFFVFADTGRVVAFTDRVVQSALVRHIKTDPAFVRALPSNLPGHESTYAEFVRDCLKASTGGDT